MTKPKQVVDRIADDIHKGILNAAPNILSQDSYEALADTIAAKYGYIVVQHGLDVQGERFTEVKENDKT